MRETWEEQLDRVRLMASGDSTWDLSENDIAALKAVLDELDTDDTNVRTVASECRRDDEARISVLEDALRNAEAERDQLREQLAAAKDYFKTGSDSQVEIISELREQRDKLLKSLKKYGRHLFECNTAYGDDRRCDCGFDAALKAAALPAAPQLPKEPQ